jgi:putative hydrolase
MIAKFDFHIHTRYSDGACSHLEIAEAAQARGLEAIAYTDHGPQLSVGVPTEKLDQMLRDISLARSDADFPVFASIEANIINENGDLDLDRNFIKRLDFLTAGIHVIESPGCVDTPHAYLARARKAIEKNKIGVLSHPFFFNSDLILELTHQEIEDFVDLAASRGVAMEISAKYKAPGDSFLRLCVKKGVKLSIGSDAHRLQEVGRIDWALSALDRIGAKRDDFIFSGIFR